MSEDQVFSINRKIINPDEHNNLCYVLKDKQHICISMVNVESYYYLLHMLSINPVAKYLLIISNPNIFTEKNINYLSETFTDTKIEIIYDSLSDYIHQQQKLHFIDFCFFNNCSLIAQMFHFLVRMCQNNGLIMINDINSKILNMCFETHINDGVLTEYIDINLKPIIGQFVGQIHHKDPVDYISKYFT